MTESQQEPEQPGLFGPIEAPEPSAATDSARSLEPLTAREKEMLLLEHSWWQFAGAKEQAIRAKWDISATRFYQQLNAIIDKKAALVWDPVTVHRLRRLRAERQRSRSARRMGIED